ncbi:MAG TPA: hypothetical protein VD833_18240, partial [Vicinamibacterales bacterium]|nr:hypothetical protein [Vicinamibacterales bacterium]
MHRRILAATILLILLGGGLARAQSNAPPTAADDKELNLTAYAELLRSDVRAQKVAIITQMMGFTEQEDAAFW